MTEPKFIPFFSILNLIFAGIAGYISYFMGLAFNVSTGNNINPLPLVFLISGIFLIFALVIGVMEYTLYIQNVDEYKQLDEMFERYPL
jgi:hypothetical protein